MTNDNLVKIVKIRNNKNKRKQKTAFFFTRKRTSDIPVADPKFYARGGGGGQTQFLTGSPVRNTK